MKDFVGGSSKWPESSGYHNRIKVCFSWTVQVRNLLIHWFFLSEHASKIRSWMVSSTVNSSSSWSKWLPQQSLNLSLGLLEQVRNLPTISFFFHSIEHSLKIHSWIWFLRRSLLTGLMPHQNQNLSIIPTTRSFSLSEHTLTPTCRAVSSDVHLNCLRKVVITTESKSVPLGQRGFETSRMTSLFCRNAPWHWLMDGLLKGSSSWSKPSGIPRKSNMCFSWSWFATYWLFLRCIHPWRFFLT